MVRMGFAIDQNFHAATHFLKDILCGTGLKQISFENSWRRERREYRRLLVCPFWLLMCASYLSTLSICYGHISHLFPVFLPTYLKSVKGSSGAIKDRDCLYSTLRYYSLVNRSKWRIWASHSHLNFDIYHHINEIVLSPIVQLKSKKFLFCVVLSHCCCASLTPRKMFI